MSDEMEEKFNRIMVVMRCGDVTPYISGTTKTVCAECGEECWITPSSQARLAQGFTPWCRECVQKLEGNMFVLPLDAQQAKEIREQVVNEAARDTGRMN